MKSLYVCYLFVAFSTPISILIQIKKTMGLGVETPLNIDQKDTH